MTKKLGKILPLPMVLAALALGVSSPNALAMYCDASVRSCAQDGTGDSGDPLLMKPVASRPYVTLR